MTKRCKFCGHKLDEKSFCTNEKCPESLRAKIVKEIETTESENTNISA